jgi:hypothetical protein
MVPPPSKNRASDWLPPTSGNNDTKLKRLYSNVGLASKWLDLVEMKNGKQNLFQKSLKKFISLRFVVVFLIYRYDQK